MDGRGVWGISPMCPDMGSACYSTYDTPEGGVGVLKNINFCKLDKTDMK